MIPKGAINAAEARSARPQKVPRRYQKRSDHFGAERSAAVASDCEHLDPILHDIQQVIGPATRRDIEQMSQSEKESFVTAVARRNVLRTTDLILQQSKTIRELVHDGQVSIVGAVYDVLSGKIEFTDARV